MSETQEMYAAGVDVVPDGNGWYDAGLANPGYPIPVPRIRDQKYYQVIAEAVGTLPRQYAYGLALYNGQWWIAYVIYEGMVMQPPVERWRVTHWQDLPEPPR